MDLTAPATRRARLLLALTLGALAALVAAGGCGSVTHSCQGSAAPCDTRRSESECPVVAGCSWGLGCGRSSFQSPADACVDLAESECNTSASCIWGIGCHGTIRKCYDILSEDQCNQMPDCEWRANQL